MASQPTKEECQVFCDNKKAGQCKNGVLNCLTSFKLCCDTRFRRAFESTNVISLKTQPHAVNACVKRSSQRSFMNDPTF